MSKILNSDITKLITKYLSIREHSKFELLNKLSKKGFELDDINKSIDEFSSKNIQSDIRFTEEFLRSRVKKNKGPRLISSELISRGIPEHLATSKISEIPSDTWHIHAHKALIKKLNASNLSIEDEDKLYSFLIGRGFDHKMIKYAIDEYKNEC
tara:strand:- start:3720 stop:4181 length:462 start_codon:yes stop_codon:yes gene_type:complete